MTQYSLPIEWFYVGRYSRKNDQYDQLSIKMGLEEARSFKVKMEQASPDARFAILGVFEEVIPKINTDSDWLFK